jgi:hypothetical protein
LNQFSDRRNLLDALTAVNPNRIATRIDYLEVSTSYRRTSLHRRRSG